MSSNNYKMPQNFFRLFLRNKKAITGTLLFMTGYVLVFLSFSFTNKLSSINSEDMLKLILRAAPIILCIIGLGYILFGYLEGNKSFEKVSRGEYPNDTKNLDYIRKDFSRYIE